MRIAVSFLLLACPLVIAVGCFGGGGVDAPPPGPSGSGATGGAGGSGGTGGDGGVGGASSSSSSSASSSGSGGTGGGIPPNACPKVPNTPEMVELVSFGTKYCIDSTEVTTAQYKAWLDTNPDPLSETIQPPECAFNTSFGSVMSPDDRPVASVDWCDAYAFCQANQKRLCGRIGGGPTPYAADYANPAVSQWHNACTMGGTRKFPYGDEYVGAACNGANMAGATLPVGSLAGCEGGFDHIFDMSGNVWEWEDSCETQTGEMDKCHRRGGGYTSTDTDLDCSTASANIMRNNSDPRTGFRCCADLP